MQRSSRSPGLAGDLLYGEVPQQTAPELDPDLRQEILEEIASGEMTRALGLLRPRSARLSRSDSPILCQAIAEEGASRRELTRDLGEGSMQSLTDQILSILSLVALSQEDLDQRVLGILAGLWVKEQDTASRAIVLDETRCDWDFAREVIEKLSGVERLQVASAFADPLFADIEHLNQIEEALLPKLAPEARIALFDDGMIHRLGTGGTSPCPAEVAAVAEAPGNCYWALPCPACGLDEALVEHGAGLGLARKDREVALQAVAFVVSSELREPENLDRARLLHRLQQTAEEEIMEFCGILAAQTIQAAERSPISRLAQRLDDPLIELQRIFREELSHQRKSPKTRLNALRRAASAS